MGFRLSYFFAPERESLPTPVKVNLTMQPEKPTTDPDMGKGRVEDLPVPVKREKPVTADILSRADSKAHSPDKGKKHQANKTAIPRRKVDPTPPAIEKAKKETAEQKPVKNETKVASLSKPKLDMRRKPSAKDVDIFSVEAIKKAIESEAGRKTEKSRKDEEAKARRPSTKVTDRPDPLAVQIERPSGSPDLDGQELDSYVMSDTGDVIDMGDEAIVSLNTKSFKYVDYFNSLKKAVELVWTYPEEAVVNRMSGKALMRFTLTNKGELVDIRLIRSSGHKVLDDEALLAVKAAAPYKPFPANLNKKRLHIVAMFVYQPSFNSVW